MRGIYRIVNKSTGKCYVGRSHNIFTRCYGHFGLLLSKKHHSKKLQEDFDQFGMTDFVLEPLEKCTIGTIKEREEFWIKKFDAVESGYNTSYNFKEPNVVNFDLQEKESFIKKAFIRATKPTITPVFLYLSEETLQKILPIFDNKIEMMRDENEILVIPDKFEDFRKSPYIFLYKDLD